MKSTLKILEVITDKDLRAFIHFPWKVYKRFPAWVPPLLIAQRELFDFQNNPFWKTHEYALFAAFEGNEMKGRIAVFYRKTSTSPTTGHFGFLETYQNYDIFEQLLAHAIQWLSKRGLKKIMGPFNPSLHHESGVLLEGFDYPPFLMMPYQPPYYHQFFQKAGMKKAMDFYAYNIPQAQSILDARLVSITDYLTQKKQISIRSIKKRQKREELEVLRRLYNRSFEGHWGFEPLDREAFDHLAAELMQIADPDLLLLAEKEGRAVGFVLCVPNFNEVFRRIRHGRLWPFGILKILWYKRKIKTVRVMTIGVLPEFRHLGIGPVLMRKITEKIIEKGYIGGEISWVAENNDLMNKAAESISGRKYKRTRIYKMEID